MIHIFYIGVQLVINYFIAVDEVTFAMPRNWKHKFIWNTASVRNSSIQSGRYFTHD